MKAKKIWKEWVALNADDSIQCIIKHGFVRKVRKLGFRCVRVKITKEGK